MMRALLFFLLGLPGLIRAQQAAAGFEIPRLALKAHILPLFNPFKTAADLVADIRLAPAFSVDLGAGRLLHSRFYADEAGESYTGLRLRGGFKYFMPTSGKHALHLGLEARYHDIRHVKVADALRQGGQYVETIQYDRNVRAAGLAFRMGFQGYFGKNDRFVWEPFCGLGFSQYNIRVDVPSDAELLAGGRLFDLEYPVGKSPGLHFLFGVHLGWCFW